MPVELRKRKAAEPAPAPPAKKQSSVAKAATKVKEAITGSKEPKAAKTNGSTSTKVAVGQTIPLEGFGGEIETNDGEKTTLKKLVDESKAGVVLFTYPKASTPGCKFKFRFKTRICANRSKAQHKHASSGTLILHSQQRVSVSMAFLATRPSLIRPSRKNRNFHTRSCVTQVAP